MKCREINTYNKMPSQPHRFRQTLLLIFAISLISTLLLYNKITTSTNVIETNNNNVKRRRKKKRRNAKQHQHGSDDDYGGGVEYPSIEQLELDYLMGNGAPPIRADSIRLVDEEIMNDETTDIIIDNNNNELQLLDNNNNNDRPTKEYLRPRRNPKGVRWTGWPTASSSNNGNDKVKEDEPGMFSDQWIKSKLSSMSKAEETAANAAGGMLPRDVGDNPWWRTSQLCFEVDQICHHKNDNTWFYYNTMQQQSNKDSSPPFQPTMELKPSANKYDGGKDICDKRISINVSSTSVITINEDDEDDIHSSSSFVNKHDGGTCTISSSRTHVVLQSLFNDMIGEFYSRTLLRLYQFMTRDVNKTMNDGNNEEDHHNKTMKKLLPWEEDVQFYVHIPYGNKKMLDGHKLLLSGMLSNPSSPLAKSFVDLFIPQQQQEQNGEDEMKNGDCSCYEKMVFCGYDVYTHNVDVPSKDVDPAIDDDDDEVTVLDQTTGEMTILDQTTTSSTTFNYDAKYTLWAAGKLDKGVELDTGSCGRASGVKGEEYYCKEWYGLRNFLSSNFVKHYPTLDRDIVHLRREMLLAKGVIDDTYKGTTKEYTVVGLTQRTYRRAWINLPQIIEACDAAAFADRVICVKVNVENTNSPFEQLVLHRSLDVMIGVHGAQLTQAILLPPDAHVLELLPWITDYIRGKWVQTRHGPTPLGVIFHNSDLNHLGYSLDRSSVPLCEGVPDEALQTCFMSQRKMFIWENRDFLVDVEPMMQYIEQFVLFTRKKERTCEELKESSLDPRFVMYNVWCSKPNKFYPTIIKGEKVCGYSANYPYDHTDPIHQSYLFDSRDDCCDAYPEACESTNDKFNNREGGNSTLTKLVWHHYDKPTQEQMTAQVVKKKRKKKRKNG